MPKPDKIVRKDAIGVRIDTTIKEAGVPINLSTVSQKDYVIVKPDGARVVRSTVFITDGSNGQIRYVTISGDLNLVGQYKLQADLVFPGGYDGPTDIGTFWVEDNL